MAFEHKEGKGSLWNNEYKSADNQPDYTGGFLLNGIQYTIAGWKATSTEGKGYMSLAIQTKVEADKYREAAKQTQAAPQGQPQDTSACDAIRAQISRLGKELGEPKALQIANSRGFPTWDDVKYCVDVARLTALKQDLDKQVAPADDGIPF